MQSGGRDHDTTDRYWVKLRRRRKRASTSDVDNDLSNSGFRLPRCELVSNGPPRSFGRPAQPVLLVDRIQLHHHAVDFERQSITFRFPYLAKLDQALDILITMADRIHLESHFLQCFERFPLGLMHRRAVREQEIREV